VQSFPVWLPLTQIWMYNQTRFLPAWVENHVLCERTENRDQFGLNNIHNFSKESRWRQFVDKGICRLGVRPFLGYYLRMSRLLGFELIHSHFGPVGWRDSKVALIVGMKHVVTFYGQDVNRLPQTDPRWNDRYRMLFSNVDAILCEGPYMKRSLVKLGCPPDRILVHHLGVNTHEVKFRPRSWRPGETLRVLIAGTFREKKGIPYALEALGRLRNDIHLAITIIGDASDDPASYNEKQRILEVIDEQQLTDRTRLLGFRSYDFLLDEAYRNHVFLSPSVTASDGDTEGGAPVVLIDMAATGMPIVSTRHCDIPEVIQDGITGFLAEERDVEGLADCLKELVQRQDEWERMTQAGRERMEKDFDAQKQAEKLAQIYQKILAT